MKKIAVYIILLSVMADCRKNNTTWPATENFPGRIGDTWTYLVNDTFAHYADSPIITQYNMTVSVTDSVQLPAGIQANLWVFNSPAVIDTNYVFKHNDTVTFLPKRDFVNLFSRQYIIPLSINHSWEYSFLSAHQVMAVSQSTITVGQNQFENAFHITGYPGRPDEIITLDEWFAEGVGIVKRYVNTFGTTNPFKHCTSWSLVSYHVQ